MAIYGKMKRERKHKTKLKVNSVSAEQTKVKFIIKRSLVLLETSPGLRAKHYFKIGFCLGVLVPGRNLGNPRVGSKHLGAMPSHMHSPQWGLKRGEKKKSQLVRIIFALQLFGLKSKVERLMDSDIAPGPSWQAWNICFCLSSIMRY